MSEELKSGMVTFVPFAHKNSRTEEHILRSRVSHEQLADLGETGVADRPPYDNWLPTVHRATLTGIAEHLKIEYEPPTDPTPELADLLRRLDDEQDKQK